MQPSGKSTASETWGPGGPAATWERGPSCRAVAGEGGRGAVTAWPLTVATARGSPRRPQASCRGQERGAGPFFFCMRDQRDRRLLATGHLTSSFGDHSCRKKMSQAGQQDPGDEWEPRRPHCTPTLPTPSGLGALSRDVRTKNRGFP